MALTPALNLLQEAVSNGVITVTLQDVTVYGGAEPLRNTVRVYIAGQKLKKDGNLDANITFTSYDPALATSFLYTHAKDGWCQFKFVIIRAYDNSKSYVQYEVAHSGGVVYRATQATTGNPPPNATFWEVISDPISLVNNVGTGTASPNLEYLIYNRVIYPNAKIFAGSKTAKAAIDCCGDCERTEDVLLYEKANVNIDALNNYDFRGQHALGEELARANDELITENA